MSWDGSGGLLWVAAAQAINQIAHLEPGMDRARNEKKVRDYFTKGAKSLDFSGKKSFHELVNEYADNVYSSLFCGLGDKDWLVQADFLLVVDAGVKELFPAPIIGVIPRQEFEQTVLQASDRAYDEQRYWTFRWETVQRCVLGKITQKKVRESLDTGRQEAYKATVGLGADAATQGGLVQTFVSVWVTQTVNELANLSGGDPCAFLTPDYSTQLFYRLLQEGGFPQQIIDQEGYPENDWQLCEDAIVAAYTAHGMPPQLMNMNNGKGKGKGKAMKGGGAWNANGMDSGVLANNGFGLDFGMGMDFGKGMGFGKAMGKSMGKFGMGMGKGMGMDMGDGLGIGAGMGADMGTGQGMNLNGFGEQPPMKRLKGGW
eukprot:CAMPEP_0117525532 /NCGR_PEP_ID=MMETSP0784-20121206/35817_1 /TAXON_ID=39447 /ORGANISM="" /LENGTH=371 /DNA_ID=CAMNT_0005321729 /DNA_START=40 /DNA_END=1155 /DNA_ORIENTATION=+